MLDAPSRFRVILDTLQKEFPGESETQLLRRIDLRLIPLLTEVNEFLPTTRDTLVGYSEMIGLIDDRLAELGHPEFKNHERLGKGKAYLQREDVTVEKATTVPPPPATKAPLTIVQEVREELWQQILSKS